MPRPWVVVVALAALALPARADVVPASLHVHAVRRSSPIAIDGRLDEPAWKTAPRQTHFIQRYPTDGAKATLDTSFAILFDDEAVYIGVWCDDPEPQQIRRLLTRRDVNGPADAIVVGIDSYHDRRTAFAFQLNAAGVQRDMMLFDDSNQDDTWDAVWTGDAAVDEHGWTAEYRIPLSQLRFTGEDVHEWGFQVLRTVGRSQEQSTWSPWPRSANQMVSKFGVVDGIEHLKPARRLELLPYVTGGFDLLPVDPGDPLNSHLTSRQGIGLDLKYGLGPAFTLSATINPDFGQVEADPSQVNLSGNELFFAEKRPFFLEGVDLFKLPIGADTGNVEGAFYSRRIGATPADPNIDFLFIDKPEYSTIYGAAKLTGKASGWSIGLLEAVTGQESGGLVDDNNVRSEPILAPLTNYAVGRVKRDFNNGETSIGLSATAVDRALTDNALAAVLPEQAYTAGAQISHRWWDNSWLLDLRLTGSYIYGSQQAIAYEQQLNRHLFQRPDATDVTFDPTATSMSGFDTSWNVGRMGDVKHWRFNWGGDLRTPGLELNDLGFQTNSDRILQFLWGQYREDAPSGQLLNWQVQTDVFTINNFEPTLIDYGIEGSASATLDNYWSFAGGYNFDKSRWNPSELRGGPSMRSDPGVGGWFSINTDSRSWLQFNLNGNVYRNWIEDNTNGGISVGATIQARSNIDIFLGPSWSERDDPLQYITEVPDNTGMPHYIFGRIKETTASMLTRVNWTFSPHLSLQIYAQPYVASGRYSELKDVDNPHAEVFGDRFHIFTGNEYRIADDVVYIDRHGHGGTDFSFATPDFDFRQLRSTVVLRWEYRPGSNVYAIWSHGATSTVDDGRFMFAHDLSQLVHTEAEELVMVKLNYWIGL